jgi:uncharacterized damage-inducible protein DinB
MAEGPTKKELINALRESGDDLIKKVSKLDDGAFEQGRYENGWNAKQILAHVASIEWTYKKLVENAKQPRSAARPNAEREAAANAAADAAPRGTGNPMDDYNERQVARRAGMSARELVQEFKENRAGTIAAVESCDEDLLQQPTRSAGGAQGTLARVIEFVAVEHVQQHTRDLVGE